MTLIFSLLIGASLAATALQPQPASPAAPAADWRPLGTSRGVVIVWNAAAIERGTTVIVPVRFTPPTPAGGTPTYSISRIELDCAAGQAHAIHTVNYRADGTLGRVDTVPVPYEAIPPGSLFDLLRRAVC